MYKHKLLIANPNLMDPVFAGKVVFLFAHSATGAAGVVLNGHPVGVVGYGQAESIPTSGEDVQKLLDKVDQTRLYFGGPCSTPSIFFIHGYQEFLTPPKEEPEFDLGITFDPEQEQWEEFQQEMTIMPGLYFGTPLTFMQIVQANKVSENKFRFFTGQAGWRAGQLEAEITAGAWTVADATPELFFDTDAINRLVLPKRYPWKPSLN